MLPNWSHQKHERQPYTNATVCWINNITYIFQSDGIFYGFWLIFLIWTKCWPFERKINKRNQWTLNTQSTPYHIRTLDFHLYFCLYMNKPRPNFIFSHDQNYQITGLSVIKYRVSWSFDHLSTQSQSKFSRKNLNAPKLLCSKVNIEY